MDLVTDCKEKLEHFRIRELKDILTQLGLSKQGKKQTLTDRILASLSDERASGIWSKKNVIGKEEVAKLVGDAYRKMQESGTTDLASKVRGVSDGTNNIELQKDIEDIRQAEKVCCPCGSSLQADSMIKCEDSRCNVWQHIGCVIIPEKPMEGLPPAPPPKFYCELCRLGRADPFRLTMAHPLPPVKLTIANPPADGTNPMQSVEKTFQLTRVDREMLVKPEYDVQVWCMLLNDKVFFRMQWPQFAKLQINGVQVRVINRPDSQLLGGNGRDDGPIITACTQDGINRISFTGCDSRVFCFGVRIVKRRTLQQILNLIPKESDGEQFEDALARVRRCIGGGAATEDADSDSDLEVVSDSIPVNLRCPMSGSRMKIAGRFKPCAHMGCFDLEVFVEMNERSRKWQCPICLKNYALENVIIDPYFTRITSKMRNCGEDVTEIEVKPDGSWRAKSDDDRRSLGDIGQWHFPDGTLCVPMEVESKPKPEPLKQPKNEGASEGQSGFGMKKNGFWEVRKPENLHSLSSGSKLPENFMNGLNVIPMSSSATGSGRNGEDTSVSQEGGGLFDYTTTNRADLDSVSLNIDTGHGFSDRNLLGDAEVIVLSDSEEEAENLISSRQIYNNSVDAGNVSFPSLPFGIPDPNHENPSLVMGGSSSLGLFNASDNDFGQHFWSSPTPTFQLFGSDADPRESLVDAHHGPLGGPMPMGGYPLAAETSIGSAALNHQSINADMNDGLVDNPLFFEGNDPPFQFFLPARPPEVTEQVVLTDQLTMSNGFYSDDLTSLRLGSSSGGGGNGVRYEPDSAAANSRQQPPANGGTLDTLADTASLLLGMSDGRFDKTRKESSDGPFSFPRQKRSVRPRWLS